MKKLAMLAFVAALLSPVTFADSAKFTVSSITGTGRTYYDCDLVERETEKLLEAFGATVSRIRCTGGFDSVNPGWSTDARVRVSFDTVRDGSVRSVELKGRDNCHLVNEIFDGVKKSFTLTDSRVSSCAFKPNGRWSLQTTVIAK